MRWLLLLYPAEWRRRYGAEMETFLRASRPGPHDVLDLLGGALDARLHPQLGPRRPGLLSIALMVVAASGAAAWALTLASRLQPVRLPGPAGTALAGAAIGLSWSAVALLASRLGWRRLAWVAALLALRSAVERAGLAIPLGQGMELPATLAGIILWSGAGTAALRRGRVPWLPALVAPAALELLLRGAQLALSGHLGTGGWASSGSYADALRLAIWAGALTWLASRWWRRCPGWGGEPPAGAPVPARPVPDPPEPLSAIGRRAG